MTYFQIVLLLTICTLWYISSATGDPLVIGSSQPVLTKVGDDEILPCHISPPVDVDKMTVEWSRPDLKPEYVHVRQQGRTIDGVLNRLYEQRTSLFAEELRRGNISLKLSRVQPSDEGTFKCFVLSLRSSSLIQLLVGEVSQPVISANGPNDDGLSLTCDSGCWYPEPEMSWLDSEGNNLTTGSSETVSYSQSQYCYVVRRNVMVKQAGNVTCRVHQPHIGRTAEIDYDYVIPGKEEVDKSAETARGRHGLTAFLVLVVLIGLLILKGMQTTKQDNNNKPSQQMLHAPQTPHLTCSWL